MIFLSIVIIALLSYIGYSEWSNRKERKTMLNAILSSKDMDTISKMTSLELTDKTDVKINNTEAPPDYTELSAASDSEFNELVTGEKTGNIK